MLKKQPFFGMVVFNFPSIILKTEGVLVWRKDMLQTRSSFARGECAHSSRAAKQHTVLF